ncbi:MAG: hypothetical protein FWK04_29575 [Nostoc sp. GBBB01]|nr:hypothetical protein [Nostoc sp. GBBB01]
MSTKPPPPPGKGSKGEPPSIEQTKSNLQKLEPGETVNLNFKVPAEFKRDFKIAAATYGCTQVELLQRIFKYWTDNQG